MPTGYTAAVQDGTIVELRDFALKCARAFVAMRDDPNDIPIPEVFPPRTSYYDEQIAASLRTLAEVGALSAEKCERRAIKECADAQDGRLQRVWKRIEQRQRYQAMLTKVAAWEPPTAEHVELKAFMSKQLTLSIECDCDDRYQPPEPPLLTGEAWRRAAQVDAASKLANASEARQAEIDRAAGRTRWVAALRESL